MAPNLAAFRSVRSNCRSMRRGPLFALLSAVVAGVAMPALASGEPTARAREERAMLTSPRSVGTPTDGALVGGVPLEEGTEVRLRWPDGARWALPHLVSLLERAARRVYGRYPGSVLLVGDLSRQAGGELLGHVSHENGRDADVGFYYS